MKQELSNITGGRIFSDLQMGLPLRETACQLATQIAAGDDAPPEAPIQEPTEIPAPTPTTVPAPDHSPDPNRAPPVKASRQDSSS